MRFLEAVRGQAGAKATIRRSLERGRFPPALIVAGAPGVGRTFFARELAKALVCGEGERKGALPCGACSACRRIENGSHPDVAFVGPDPEKASFTVPIENVRAALEEMSLAPVEAPRRVFVFDPADAMLEESLNTLLKALEEPPPSAHLVLVAAREGALLATVGSRCLSVELGPLGVEDVREILRARGIAQPEIERRAAWAGGSPGRALSEDLIPCSEAALPVLEALASGAARKDPIGVAKGLVDVTGGKGAEPKVRRARALLVLDAIVLALGDALVACERGGAEGGRSGADPGLVARLASSAPSAQAIVRAVEATLSAEDAISENKHTTLVLEGVVIDLAALLSKSRGRVGISA